MTRQAALPAAARELLLKEFDQAWHHARQVESRATQSLGFVFALAVGTAATTVSIAGTAQPLAIRLLAVSGVLLLFEWISVVTFVVMRKLNAVGTHYETVFRRIRVEIYGTDPARWPVALSDLDIRIGRGRERLFRSRLTSVSWISDTLMLGAGGIAAVVIAGLGARLFVLRAPGWEKAVLAAVTTVAIALPVTVRWLLGPLDRRPRPAVPPPQP